MPSYLSPGDTIALFAPASPLASLEALPHIVSAIEAHGYRVVYENNLHERLPAAARAASALAYLKDPQVAALWAVRGGEGAADLIPFFERERDTLQKTSPKWIMGFSDITTLLLYFSRCFHWPCVHGPVAAQLVQPVLSDESKRAMFDVLSGKNVPMSFSALTPLNAVVHADIHAPVIAGNMRLMSLSFHEPWEFDLSGHVVCLEDWHEKGYQLHRTLKHWQRIGKFADVRALVFGDMTYDIASGEKDDARQLQAEYIQVELREFAQSCEFPVYQTPAFGHGFVNTPILFEQKWHVPLTLQG